MRSILQQTRESYILLSLLVLFNLTTQLLAWIPTGGRVGRPTIIVRKYGTKENFTGEKCRLRSLSSLSASGEDASEDQANAMDITGNDAKEEEVDVAIIGAGIGGLCAGAILNTLYGKEVGVYESHYLPGGCAHAFDRKASNGMTFTFDSGPTILLG